MKPPQLPGSIDHAIPSARFSLELLRQQTAAIIRQAGASEQAAAEMVKHSRFMLAFLIVLALSALASIVIALLR